MTRKVLLISDNGGTVQFIKHTALMLTKLNHQVTIEDESIMEKALKRSASSNLDLIILDLDSKSMDAVEFIANMRKERKSKNKKLVGFSAGITEELKSKAFSAGCDSIMTKDELLTVVSNILEF